ncbi:hypothetical protein MLD38_019427 [Melastoma candidum]|uniref:Uncharacterized protein n=1 Tax=Melastoma candidum TaxID=119954 RepID=A0ACB9QW39_9MYRT|nr:hypothetical protein MLD38_019427 [Melastoma candidum]
MDGPDLRRKKSLRERLGLVGGCCGGGCGPTWGFRTNTVSVLDDEDEVDDVEILPPQQLPPEQQLQQQLDQEERRSDQGMNLAAALAAERQYRALQEGELVLSPPGTPLMRLLEEDGRGGELERSEWGCCCVCMGRQKGSAFIPCGHTFCRVCSREVWVNRGTCPLCNRPIHEILDIF